MSNDGTLHTSNLESNNKNKFKPTRQVIRFKLRSLILGRYSTNVKRRQSRFNFLPAQPKAKWYLEEGLNLTQHTLAFASMLATELSRLVDHSFTKSKGQ